METLELISKILIAATMLCGAIGMIMSQARNVFDIKNDKFKEIEEIASFVFYCGCVIGVCGSITIIIFI